MVEVRYIWHFRLAAAGGFLRSDFLPVTCPPMRATMAPETFRGDAVVEQHRAWPMLPTRTSRLPPLFKSPEVKDGNVHLRFQASLTGKAFVNEIHLRPERIVCRPMLCPDESDDIWPPDRVREDRHWKFSGSIPVAEGKYKARLTFRENWFVASNPGKGGAEGGVFGLFCNFGPLRRSSAE